MKNYVEELVNNDRAVVRPTFKLPEGYSGSQFDITALGKVGVVALPFEDCYWEYELYNSRNNERIGVVVRTAEVPTDKICFRIEVMLRNKLISEPMTIIIGKKVVVDGDQIGLYMWDKARSKEDFDFCSNVIYYVCYHICMLSCKNIDVVDIPLRETITIPRHRTKKVFRRVQYKTLSIFYRKGCINKNGKFSFRAETALHVVRGHFKRRKTGLFWWNPHMRGNAEHGVIDKSYHIKE